MKRLVLIDGENLTYGLRHLLGADGNKAPRSAIDNFDFRGLIEDILSDNKPTDILWFGARLKKYENSDDLKQKSEDAIKSQAKFMNHIQSQRINFIKVGYLRARESDPCDSCRHQSWRLTEKGVDVGLAVRMLTEADEDTELVVISGDTDLLPAFKAVTQKGAKIMHIGYEHRSVFALVKASDNTRIITIPLVREYQANSLSS